MEPAYVSATQIIDKCSIQNRRDDYISYALREMERSNTAAGHYLFGNDERLRTSTWQRPPLIYETTKYRNSWNSIPRHIGDPVIELRLVTSVEEQFLHQNHEYRIRSNHVICVRNPASISLFLEPPYIKKRLVDVPTESSIARDPQGSSENHELFDAATSTSILPYQEVLLSLAASSKEKKYL